MPKETILIGTIRGELQISEEALQAEEPLEDFLGYEEALKLENEIAKDLAYLDANGHPITT